MSAASSGRQGTDRRRARGHRCPFRSAARGHLGVLPGGDGRVGTAARRPGRCWSGRPAEAEQHVARSGRPARAAGAAAVDHRVAAAWLDRLRTLVSSTPGMPASGRVVEADHAGVDAGPQPRSRSGCRRPTASESLAQTNAVAGRRRSSSRRGRPFGRVVDAVRRRASRPAGRRARCSAAGQPPRRSSPTPEPAGQPRKAICAVAERRAGARRRPGCRRRRPRPPSAASLGAGPGPAERHERHARVGRSQRGRGSPTSVSASTKPSTASRASSSP